MRRITPVLAFLAVVLFARAADAQAMVNFANSGSRANTSVNLTLGFSFTTNQALLLNSLAFFFAPGAPTADRGDVRLYTASGTVLAQTRVLTTDPSQSIGNLLYNFQTLATPVSLSANTTYYLAGDLPASPSDFVLPVQISGLNTDPGITYGSPVSSVGLGGKPTTDLFNGVYNPGIFLVNAQVTSVPEPTTLTRFVAILGGVLAVRRWKAARGERTSSEE